MLTDDLQSFISQKRFPTDEEYVRLLATSQTRFVDQEGPNWDFKKEWPYSYSDSYYEGIARLICAFSNAQGGYIVFGVHDEERLGGYNKVKINLDRLQAALTHTLSLAPLIEVRQFRSERLGDTTCLMVMPRPQGVRPYRLVKGTAYPTNIIWVRQGHEVQRADPRHIPILYCRSSDQDDLQQELLAGSLPPNPRTLKKFVGRLEAFDLLFDWIFNSDEPRMFLWGKGGSGKTSIAYEFARVLRRYGRALKMFDGSGIDNVIFLTAKERKLDPVGGEQRAVDPDFADERSLYAKLLQYGGGHPTMKC